jgi:hypothetical protein
MFNDTVEKPAYNIHLSITDPVNYNYFIVKIDVDDG